MNATVQPASRTDWCTPKSYWQRVLELGPIALDPCSNPESTVPAKLSYYEAGDGLTKRWSEVCRFQGGLAFVNPPYGRPLRAWTEKCVIEARKGCSIVALLPARTCTKWFHESAAQADALCFQRGRMRFDGGEHCANFSSMTAYWGPAPERFAEVFGELGLVVFPRGRHAA